MVWDGDDEFISALSVIYNDLLVNPPLLGATTVQEAIDKLKVRTFIAPSRVALSAMDTTNAEIYTDGIVIDGLGRLSYWTIDKISTLTVDNVNVLNAVPAGRWIRKQIPIFRYVSQLTWWFDSVNGDDDNDGLTSGTALKTGKEWFARTQAQVLGSPSFILNDNGAPWPVTDRFNYQLVQRDPNSNTSNVSFFGTRTLVAIGNLTANSTNPVNTAGGETATIKDAARVWVVDQLVTFGNGAQCFVLADLGGGVAEVTPFTDLNGNAVAAPPNTTQYIIQTITQMNFELTPSGDSTLTVQDVQNISGIRSVGRTVWKRCLFSQVSGYIPNGFFIGCLFSCGSQLTLGKNSGGEVWASSLKFAMCGFRNSPVLIDGSIEVEFQSVVCKGGGVAQPLVKVGTSAGAVLSPAGSPGTLTISGHWGLGLLDGPAGGLDVVGDSLVFIGGLNLQLWGKGNVTFGTRVGLKAGAKVRLANGITPTCASTGVELLFNANPIPALVGGAAVPAQAACATWAAFVAAPFNGFAQTLDLQTNISRI